MFQQARPNSIIYMLQKGEEPSMSIGTVVSVSQPMPRYNTSFPTQPYGQDMVVDIVAQFDDEKRELRQLSANLSIAEIGVQGIVVSDDRTAMMAEVESYMNASKKAIESMPHHQKVIESCADMLSVLNPQIAKDRATEERFSSLESNIESMQSSIKEVIGMLGRIGGNIVSKKGD